MDEFQGKSGWPMIFTAQGRTDPGGLWVRHLFPTKSRGEFEPFLLFEQIGPMILRAGEGGGPDSRPLSSLEAVTYVLEGELEVAHSGGNRAVLGPGDVQWATVGTEVTHSDVPSRRLREQGGPLSAIRAWVRLPSRLASVEPRFQEVRAASIPEVKLADAEASVRVVAGEAFGSRGPVETASPVSFQVWSLAPGSAVSLPIPPSQGGFVYVLEGTVGVGVTPTQLDEGEIAQFSPGEVVRIHGYVSPEPVALLLVLAGEAGGSSRARSSSRPEA
jgi:redox-sensitive bicupin YhaK (pirin superfamily)